MIGRKKDLPKLFLETNVQAAIRQKFALCGFVVRSTSQVRPSMVAVGLPDLRFHHSIDTMLGGDFETKAPVQSWTGPDGVIVQFDPYRKETWFPKGLRESQRQFRADAMRAGHLHYWGGEREAEAALVLMHFAEYIGSTLEVRIRSRRMTPRIDESTKRAAEWLDFVTRTSKNLPDPKPRRRR